MASPEIQQAKLLSSGIKKFTDWTGWQNGAAVFVDTEFTAAHTSPSGVPDAVVRVILQCGGRSAVAPLATHPTVIKRIIGAAVFNVAGQHWRSIVFVKKEACSADDHIGTLEQFFGHCGLRENLGNIDQIKLRRIAVIRDQFNAVAPVFVERGQFHRGQIGKTVANVLVVKQFGVNNPDSFARTHWPALKSPVEVTKYTSRGGNFGFFPWQKSRFFSRAQYIWRTNCGREHIGGQVCNRFRTHAYQPLF